MNEENHIGLSQTALEEDQFLKLPDECFIRIFKFLDFPSSANVALVCSRFYELICDLERDKHPLELCYSQIYDDDIFDSIIASRRRICDLTINLKGCRVVSSLQRIEAVVAKFGNRLKKFKIWSSIQNESSELELPPLLTLLPIVEALSLRNLNINAGKMPSEELDLCKLRKLVLDYCMFDSSVILDSIPQDVLTELVFTFESSDAKSYQNFFNRQKNINKLEIFENDEINFNHLQLEHLKIGSSHNFVSILKSQPQLRYLDFTITWIEDDVFSSVCELKHLETFRTLIDQVSCREFKSLRKVSTLKELRLESYVPYDNGYLLELSMMKCLQMEKLSLLFYKRNLPEQILIQMSDSFKRLRHLEVINRSIKVIKIVMENFTLLESILFDYFSTFGAPEDILEISDGFSHEMLKQLVITNVNVNECANTRALVKLVNACPNLERIMLSELQSFSLENLKQIFDNHLNLSHLSLEFDEFELTLEEIAVIKTSGKNLALLRLKGLSNFPSYPMIKTLFEYDFENIKFYKYSNGYGELIMKKRNIVDWRPDFKLMEHF